MGLSGGVGSAGLGVAAIPRKHTVSYVHEHNRSHRSSRATTAVGSTRVSSGVCSTRRWSPMRPPTVAPTVSSKRAGPPASTTTSSAGDPRAPTPLASTSRAAQAGSTRASTSTIRQGAERAGVRAVLFGSGGGLRLTPDRLARLDDALETKPSTFATDLELRAATWSSSPTLPSCPRPGLRPTQGPRRMQPIELALGLGPVCLSWLARPSAALRPANASGEISSSPVTKAAASLRLPGTFGCTQSSVSVSANFGSEIPTRQPFTKTTLERGAGRSGDPGL